MFDISNLFGAAKPGAGGWTTTVQYGKNPLTFSLDDKLAGVSAGGVQGAGGALSAYGKQMGQEAAAPSQGAFATPPMPPAPQEPAYQPVQRPPVSFAPVRPPGFQDSPLASRWKQILSGRLEG